MGCGVNATVPVPSSEESRNDVAHVVESRARGVTIEEIATDFGVHMMTFSKRLRRGRIVLGKNDLPTGVPPMAQAN